MHAARTGDFIVLAFNSIESRIFGRLLQVIAANYQVAPDALDPKAAEAWYSRRGCDSAGMTADETRDWRQELHRLKSTAALRLEAWSAALGKPQEGRRELRLSLADAPTLLTALNDHRLLAAARQDIGQAEMDLHSLKALEHLPAVKQAALHEIHFLAWVMEEILRLLNASIAL